MTSCSTNRFVISKSKLQGYLAIYFMLISNQSNFSEIYMTPYRTVIMEGLLCVFLFTAKKEIKTYCTLFFAFLIMYALLIRLSVGGISTKFVEAMSLAVPSICTAVGGTDAFVTDGVDGVLIKDNSVHEVLDKLMQIVNMDSSEMRSQTSLLPVPTSVRLLKSAVAVWCCKTLVSRMEPLSEAVFC